ncbi:PREDICTED: uncharacterized protein LOC108762256 [Trachymyrmex cornetzi]|uniref:uncharacterized protein LOC108762256 n=1 Tax=Trachymyrmex cornetzi TaxID=471704 RepID=UPI00084F09D8|nr:PREDICTED: uncharacterized protein LOC108762256 [Trachymyrmex cornetzi]
MFTKRIVLAETAWLFDPLGWLAPMVIQAKILIQSAWLQRLDWDAPLPSTIAVKWQRLFEGLPSLQKLRVRCWLGTDNSSSHLELHGFADASERGYAAVVYLRINSANLITTRLFVAKSKVAPIKPISLPRLELCAAALLTNLLAYTRTVLNLSTTPVILWSDSKVTLCWIHGHASRWKTYVANRVSQIQQQLPESRWCHVPGKKNPADCASRGLAPSELLGHPLWWTGPAWLRGNVTEWPSGDEELPIKDTPEQRSTTHIAATRSNLQPEFLLKFSALHSFLRITSWCLRWRRRPAGSADEDRDRSTLHPAELDEALLQWTRVVQTLHYPKEMTAIATNRCLPRKSRLSHEAEQSLSNGCTNAHSLEGCHTTTSNGKPSTRMSDSCKTIPPTPKQFTLKRSQTTPPKHSWLPSAALHLAEVFALTSTQIVAPIFLELTSN